MLLQCSRQARKCTDRRLACHLCTLLFPTYKAHMLLTPRWVDSLISFSKQYRSNKGCVEVAYVLTFLSKNTISQSTWEM